MASPLSLVPHPFQKVPAHRAMLLLWLPDVGELVGLLGLKGAAGRRRDACWSAMCSFKAVTQVTRESYSGSLGSKVHL